MASPPADRPPYVKLSTVEAARLLGVSRKTTHRMCAGSDRDRLPMPDGWTADKESRPQGERWIFYVPVDDPHLAGGPPMGAAGRGDAAAPTTPSPDVPDGDVPVPGAGTSPDPDLVRLAACVADLARASRCDWQALAEQRETIGRLRAQLADRDARIAALEARLVPTAAPGWRHWLATILGWG